jgi:nucleotide-binding universal stress UspA family protein
MMERRKVVVGYDGTAASDAALADLRRAGLPGDLDCVVLNVTTGWVTREQERAERSLEDDEEAVIQAGRGAVKAGAVAVAPAVVSRPEIDEGAVHEARVLAESAAARLAQWFPRWAVRVAVRPEAPAWGIAEFAREWGADLVVVGTHDRSGLGRLIHGSVFQTLLVDAPCSVRVARSPWTSEPAAQRIVIGLDGSRDADAAIGEVAERTWPAGSAAHLVSAYNPVFMPGTAYFGMSIGLEDFNDEDLREVFDQQARARTVLALSGLTITQSVRLDDPVALLLEEAGHWGADTIVLGARGHRAIERILLGSVSASVARRAHCSVEVIRPWA